MSSHRSIALIAIIVFGVLFALLYSSSVIATQNAQRFYEVLASKKVDVEVHRTRISQNICFELDSTKLKEVDEAMKTEQGGVGDTLSRAMNSADVDAQSDKEYEEQLMPSKEYFEQMGNLYTGELVSFEDGKAILPLIQAYETKFTHTSTHKSIRGFSDDVHDYSCNITYQGKGYNLSIKLRSLTSLNDYSGFVPISVTRNRVIATLSRGLDIGAEQIANVNHSSIGDPRVVKGSDNLTVFNTFNNTAVWINNLGSSGNASPDEWVNLKLSSTDSEGNPFSIATKIPPGKSWDYRLSPNYRNNVTIYQYQIDAPGLGHREGSIMVNYSPRCMDLQQAKSLYAQNSFELRFPSYVPANYHYICGLQNDGFMLVQTYWNQSKDTAVDIFHNGENEPFENYASHDNALQAGIIQIWSAKAGNFYHPEANSTAYERLKQITDNKMPESRYYVEPRIVQVSPDPDVSALAYKRFSDLNINILEIYDHGGKEAYFIRGKMPLDELMKMAQSMFTR